MTTPSNNLCPSCGTPLPSAAPRGLCPACLLKRGLESNTLGFTAPDAPPKDRWQPPTPDDLAPLFPELQIQRLLGRGGMGAVYLARQIALDRPVALKILPPNLAQDPSLGGFSERFTREAQAMARLNHPHIVTIHEFGTRNPSPSNSSNPLPLSPNPLFFFLMEYVDGMSLRALLDTGHISPKEALAIVPQICDALQYAHDHGIVHRDIKPENILLNQSGQVKIADFGLAKLVGKTQTQSLSTESDASGEGASSLMTHHSSLITSPAGTPAYMAPEQLSHPAEVDHRADIYSLGVVFYQMLTGQLPATRLEPPSAKVHIDVRLDQIVLRALEKTPELRFQNATQFKTEVETIISTPASSEISNPKSEIPYPTPASSAATRDPPGINIEVEMHNSGKGHTFHLLKNIPLVGLRHGKRALNWPGIFLAAFCFAFFIEVGAFIFYAVFSAINHQWLPIAYPLLALFLVPLLFPIGIRRAWNMPADLLQSLDPPPPHGNPIPPDEAARYEQRAPGWVIRCRTCGFSEPWGKYGIRLGGAGRFWTVGWCTHCHRIRSHFIEKRDVHTPAPPLPQTPAHASEISNFKSKIPHLLFRWSARILGTLLALLILTFFFAEGSPPLGKQPASVQIEFAAMALWLAGFLLGWRYESLAAFLILLASAIFHLVERRFPLNWPLEAPTLIGLLYLAAHLTNSNSPTPTHTRRRRYIRLAALLLAVTAIVATQMFVKYRDDPARHFQAMEDIDNAWRLHLPQDPSQPDRTAEYINHRDALVSLGQLDRKLFVLVTRPGTSDRDDILCALNEKAAGRPLFSWTPNNHSLTITVWATPADMPSWEKLLSRWPAFLREGLHFDPRTGQPITFTPVTELTLDDVESNQAAAFVDFETGRRLGPPPEIKEPQLEAWQASSGADAGANVLANKAGLFGTNMKFLSIPAERWYSLTPDFLRTELQPLQPKKLAVAEASPDSLPATYLFQTPAGSQGILQITAFTPKTLTLRYKLLTSSLPAATSTAPTTSHPANSESVTLIVSPTGLTFQDAPTTWDDLPALLEKVPDRPHTILAMKLASNDMTLAQHDEAFSRLAVLARKYNFRYASDTGIVPPALPTRTMPATASQPPNPESALLGTWEITKYRNISLDPLKRTVITLAPDHKALSHDPSSEDGTATWSVLQDTYLRLIDDERPTAPPIIYRFELIGDMLILHDPASDDTVTLRRIPPATSTSAPTSRPATLDFRIAVPPSALDPAQPDVYQSLAKNGPSAPLLVTGTAARWINAHWFEVHPLAKDTLQGANFITAARDGTPYLLCYDDHDHTLTHSDPARLPWSLSAANPIVQPNGSVALPLKIDTAGAAYMGQLTLDNKGRPLAILLDNRVLSAPTIQSQITDAALITFGTPTPARPAAALQKEAENIQKMINPASQSQPASQPANPETALFGSWEKPSREGDSERIVLTFYKNHTFTSTEYAENDNRPFGPDTGTWALLDGSTLRFERIPTPQRPNPGADTFRIELHGDSLVMITSTGTRTGAYLRFTSAPASQPAATNPPPRAASPNSLEQDPVLLNLINERNALEREKILLESNVGPDNLLLRQLTARLAALTGQIDDRRNQLQPSNQPR